MMHHKRNKILLATIWMCSILLTINFVKKYEELVPQSKNILGDYLVTEDFTPTLDDAYEETEDYNIEKPNSIHAPSCRCKKIIFPKRKVYIQEMARKMNWLNLTTLEHLAKHHPNFPTSIMPFLLEGRCHLIPVPLKMPWSSRYWQEVHVEDTTFFLYSAVIDNRPLIAERPVVRIIAHTMSETPKVPWCYLWFNASGPPVVSSIRLEYGTWMEKSSKHVNHYLMMCRLPENEAHRKPVAVSVVDKPCATAQNLLEVNGAMERDITQYREGKPPVDGDSTPPKFNVAACGTALFYYHEDFSFRLVEWIEILRAIGFSKVFLHESWVHPNISKVLQHYEEEGFIAVTKHSYIEPIVNEPSILRLWRLTEFTKIAHDLSYFNDCLLRHMHEYRFIAHIDPDEVPMMVKHDSYLSWMDDTLTKAATKIAKMPLKKEPMPCSYALKWRTHYNDLSPSGDNKDLPGYLWYLRHSKVMKKEGGNIKSLYDMDAVIAVVSHYVLRCATRKKQERIDRFVAYTGHFKKECKEICQDPGVVEEMKFILRYKDQIETAVTRVLKKLNLI